MRNENQPNHWVLRTAGDARASGLTLSPAVADPGVRRIPLVMPFDAKSFADIRDRHRKELLTMGAALMNNTKWREVLQRAASHGLWYQVALVGDSADRDCERLCSPHPPQFLDSMIADPGLTGGGPHEYWEILWVRYPRIFRNRGLNAFLGSVKDLGVLPLVTTDAQIEIRGYENPAA